MTGLTAAGAVRAAFVALLAVPALLLAGCGSDQPATAIDQVQVDGKPGEQPKVTFDQPLQATATQSKVLTGGDGPKVTAGEHVLVDYVGVNGRNGKPFDSSWARGRPVPFELQPGKMIKGFVKGLVGKKVGSRVLLTIPPKDAYGKQGQQQAKIRGTDTLVFVVDVEKAYKPLAHAEGTAVKPAAGLPSVTAHRDGTPARVVVPDGATPPARVTAEPVIKGSGPKVGKDDSVTLHYLAVNWRTGKTVFSTWKSPQAGAPPQPADLSMSEAVQVVPGFTSLVGQTAGSRVVIVMPLDKAFGQQKPSAKQLSGAGLKKSDSLVFVVDILGAA